MNSLRGTTRNLLTTLIDSTLTTVTKGTHSVLVGISVATNIVLTVTIATLNVMPVGMGDGKVASRRTKDHSTAEIRMDHRTEEIRMDLRTSLSIVGVTMTLSTDREEADFSIEKCVFFNVFRESTV